MQISSHTVSNSICAPLVVESLKKMYICVYYKHNDIKKIKRADKTKIGHCTFVTCPVFLLFWSEKKNADPHLSPIRPDEARVLPRL